MSEALLRAVWWLTLAGALASLVGLAYTGSAWLHDLREHPGGGHGPGALGVALAGASLAVCLAARAALRRLAERP